MHDTRKMAEELAEACAQCGACARVCPFLEEQVTPGHAARAYLAGTLAPETGFHCSLCGLCSGLCPKGLAPREFFLALREEAVGNGFSLAPAKPLLFFERMGLSSALTFFGLPRGCSDVFWPGCVLPGQRPETVWQTFLTARDIVPDMGLALACCAKPSRLLGRREFHEQSISRMVDRLNRAGIKRVHTGCPNCLDTLRDAKPNFEVSPIYPLLADAIADRDNNGGDHAVQAAAQAGRASASGSGDKSHNERAVEAGNRQPTHSFENTNRRVTFHDPCPLRFEPEALDALRVIARSRGYAVSELPHHGKTTLCCGEGGGVGFFRPEFALAWKALRQRELTESEGKTNLPVVASCGGCVGNLSDRNKASHVLDLLAGHSPDEPPQLSKPPFTYLNRIRLKFRAWQFFRGK